MLGRYGPRGGTVSTERAERVIDRIEKAIYWLLALTVGGLVLLWVTVHAVRALR